MALSRTGKIWIILLSIPVVLIAGGIVAAKLYFTSDRLKSFIIPKIEESTHRTVSVNEIGISVFPSIAVSIDGLKISNPRGSSFDRDEFLSLDNLRLKLALMPLLRGKTEINYVILTHPRVYLEVSADGSKNYSGNAAAKQGSKEAKSESSGAGALLVSDIEITEGEIESVDKKYDSHMMISGFRLAAAIQPKLNENTIHIDGTSSADKISYGSMKSWYLSDQPLNAMLKLTYALDKDVLTFDDVSMKLKELPVTISGSIADLQQPALQLHLDVNSPAAEMNHLLSLIPPEMLKKTEGLTSTGEVKFSMAIQGESSEKMNPGIKGAFSVTKGKIQYAALPKSINNIDIMGSFEKPSAPIGAKGIGSFSIDKLSATVGSNTLGGNMKLTNFDDPNLKASFNGLVNLDEVKDYYPLEKGTTLNGTLKSDVAVEGKARVPETMKASGAMAFENVTIAQAASPKPVKNLNGTITFNNQLIESKRLSMTVGESDLNLAFTLKNYLGMMAPPETKPGSKEPSPAAKPVANVTLTSRQLRTADLMSSEQPATGGGKTDAPPKKAGLVPGIDMDANVAIDKLVTDKFTFTNVHGTAALAGGVVNLKNMALNAFQGSIQTKGTLDLRDPKTSPFDLDLDIKEVESNSLLSNFTSFGKYLFGKFSTGTKLKGDLNDTMGLNTATLLGEGTVHILDGKLLGFPLTEKLADVTNVTDLRAVNFKNWANSFSISNGRLNIKDLKVNAGATDFLAGGSQGLDGSMDYSLTVKLPASVSDQLKLGGGADQLLQFLKDSDGRFVLTFDVSGMATNPVLKLNAKAQEDAAKSALQRKTDEGKKKLEDDLKKKAEEGLKKLFKRP